MQQGWHQLAPLKRGKDTNEYSQRFMELLFLVGETPATVGLGSQPFNIYDRHMDAVARPTWSGPGERQSGSHIPTVDGCGGRVDPLHLRGSDGHYHERAGSSNEPRGGIRQHYDPCHNSVTDPRSR